MITNNKKFVLITGSAKRIGKEILLEFAKNNWQVILHYNNSLEEALELKEKTNAILYQCDLTSPAAAQNMIKVIEEKFGPLSLLINNASHFENDSIFNLTEESLTKHFQVNLFSPLLMIKAFLEQNYIKQGNEGIIININDYLIKTPSSGFLSYYLSRIAMEKANSNNFNSTLPENVRINTIAIGATMKNNQQTKAHFQKICETSRIKGAIPISDIIKAINFVIDCKSLSNQTIFIDKGR